MLGRSGSWVGSSGGSGSSFASGRLWLYQDFTAGSGPSLTLIQNDNGSGITFDATRIINSTACATRTDGTPIYISTTEIPANVITVLSHAGAAVTLSGTPAAGEGTVRVWYLYSVKSTDSVTGTEIAPRFVTDAQTAYLDSQYLNQGLNLSDLANASTARTNLGFVAQTAGRVLLGDGSTTFTSDALLQFDISNKRLGLGTATPSEQLHLYKSSGSATILMETQSTGNGALAIFKASRNAGANLAVNDVAARMATLGMVSAAYADLSFIDTEYLGSGTTQIGDLVFKVANTTTPDERLRIVGTGGITVTGNLTSTAQIQSATFLAKTSLKIEDPGAGSFLVTIQAPTLAASYTLTLPVDDGNANQLLQTDGNGVLSWASAGVNSGGAGRLALYPSTGSTVDDIYVQNANNIDIAIATHTALASAREYTIPDSGADASFVMTAGAQTLAGIKTFSATPLLKTALDLEDPGGGTNKITLQSGTISVSYTLTLPTAQGAANTTLVNDGSGTLSWTTPVTGKAGTVSLSLNATTKAIVFATTRANSNYTVVWTFKNTTDGTPAQRAYNVIAQGNSGFTVEWNDALDTANYVGLWAILEHYDP